jgi:hypothetical protein
MIAQKKPFFCGVVMMAGFILILILIFSPIFKGQNGLEYLDDLYNSISKGSAYYIPKLKEKSNSFSNTNIELKLLFESEEQADKSARLFVKNGSAAEVSGNAISVSGDLGQILKGSLEDADLMYQNNGNALKDKYDYGEKRVLFYWWNALTAMEKELKKQKKFKEAKIVLAIKKKAVETSYNYYQIEPQSISDRYGIVIFSLVFYVIYTLWYGFGIMFLFEGWGLRLEH